MVFGNEFPAFLIAAECMPPISHKLGIIELLLKLLSPFDPQIVLSLAGRRSGECYQISTAVISYPTKNCLC